MFKLIGINLIFDLLNDEWFGWMLAGAAFGGAVGLLRERDRLVATLQRLDGRGASAEARGCRVLVPLQRVDLPVHQRSVAVRIIARGRFGRGLLSRILAWREKARGMRRDRHCAFRSEEHTSELQSLMRISYAVFCLKKKNI